MAVLALSLAAGGCRASASASINTGQKQQDESFDEDAPGPVGTAEADTVGGDYALLGARQDLHLAPDQKTPVCSCLAAALGGPADPKFKWDGPVPQIDPQNQLIVAVSSEGIACAEAKEGSIGASYWGYRQSGDDVVVIVENARLGRPMTQGAVIPKPIGAGQVYVRPASKSVPYGKPLVTGDKWCKLGNPGPTRNASSPSSDEEESDW